jgi:hypothetical protein
MQVMTAKTVKNSVAKSIGLYTEFKNGKIEMAVSFTSMS